MSTPVDTAPAAQDFLRFVWDQSYNKSFGEPPDDWAAAVDPVPGIDPIVAATPLAAGLHAALDEVPYPVDWARPAHRATTLPDVQALLYNALGILRREPRTPHNNDHRAFPSPRSLFPTHAYYVSQGETGLSAVHYDPVGHALQPVASTRALPSDGAADGIVALTSHYTHIPDYYRSLRYTLALLEAGHCLYTLGLVARALGLASRVVLSFDDEALLTLLRLDPARGWIVPAAVEVGRAGGALPAPVNRRACAAGVDDAAPVDRASWLEHAEARQAWGRLEPPAPAPLPAGAFAIADPDSAASAVSTAQVLFDRNAGRGVHGVSGAQCGIPRSVVSRALREGFRPLDSDLRTGRGWSQSGLRVLLAAERVADLEDGLYEVCPDEQMLAPLRRGRLLPELQRAFPPSLYVATCHLAWFLVVDYPRIIAARGPRGFRVANLELGWVAQAIGCALAADGLFARPCRSYHEPVLDSVLGLSPTESVGYAVVCGVNRFHDIRLDLRC